MVTPDNGTLTHIKKLCGITEARVIDETVNRLPGSGESYTFHGRDIYAYTGARLASGIIDFEGVGPEVPVDSVVEIPFEPARLQEMRYPVPSMCWMSVSAAFGRIYPGNYSCRWVWPMETG